MRVLVTGATGFIGSLLVAHLLAQGDVVRALVGPESDARYLESCGVEICRARCELQYAPKVSVPDSIRRTTDWYRGQGLL